MSGQTSGSAMHTLMISANGPVDYEFTVDGTLEADTEFGDFSADEDDIVFDPDGPAGQAVRDETGPRPENAGETNFLGDRFIISGYAQLTVVPEPGYDAYVYVDEMLVSPLAVELPGYVNEWRSVMITANGPTAYELLLEGAIQPDTDSGDFSADSDEATTQNADGTVTVADTTGPRPADAGGRHFLGDRYRFNGSIEALSLDYDRSQYEVNVYFDEQNVG
ncbi:MULTISPECIES: hypothetical protein [Haloferax]|uniref:Uncharacterized protein n=2 Tax=Haloferax TaxID=2251 RepID=A0A6G1Z204_9EURY|nr:MULTISPECIES: hypothetical protein [Haloferax]KAB1187807.1 hypothetical protein Hfx1149_07085 [Haloferax sp. CBA1149]MRW80468.1 hypothetical protein [Haloferax marinisediminis]